MKELERQTKKVFDEIKKMFPNLTSISMQSNDRGESTCNFLHMKDNLHYFPKFDDMVDFVERQKKAREEKEVLFRKFSLRKVS